LDNSESGKKPPRFQPSSASHARLLISGKDDKMMHRNPYDYSKFVSRKAKVEKAEKILFGEFLPSSTQPLRGSSQNSRYR
jgi:hypothetical protein